MASRLFDYDQIVKPFLGIDGANQFYDATLKDWKWNSRYWHQIAHLRLDLASQELDPTRKEDLAELAVQHARFSKSIEADHQFTYTTIGKTLFGKFEVLGTSTAKEIDEAISSLERAISIEDRKDRKTVHPYMILFDGLSKQISRGVLLSFEQKRNLRTRIREAQTKFPKDIELRERGRSIANML